MIRWAAILFLAFPALAQAPDAHSDSALARWFESLTQPGTGIRCCSTHDCRTVTTRTGPNGFEAFVSKAKFGPTAPDAWVVVQERVVIRSMANPTGEPVLCFVSGSVICFLNGPGI